MAEKVVQEKYVDIYDVYKSADWKYGNPNSTNLNPQHEVAIKQRNVIKYMEDRLQQLTDDLIRKQIAPKQEAEIYPQGLGSGESLPQGIPFHKMQAINRVGSTGNALLFPAIAVGFDIMPIDTSLERLIGIFPGDTVDELDLPPIIECEDILKGIPSDYQANDDQTTDASKFKEDNGLEDKSPGSTGFSDQSGSGGGGAGGGGDGGDTETIEDEEVDPEVEDPDLVDMEADERVQSEQAKQVAECAKIELGWLKIILVLIKVIKILRILVDLVLGIIMPIVNIVQLACGAWLNPTNLYKIAQLIMGTIVALLTLIIGQILQLIWDMLNLDCVCDQVDSLIKQMNAALSAFASLTNAFNPTAINYISESFKKRVADPLEEAAKEVEKHAAELSTMDEQWIEAFQSFGAEMKKQFVDGLKDNMLEAVKGGVAQSSFGKAGVQVSANGVSIKAGSKLQGTQNAAVQMVKNANQQQEAIDDETRGDSKVDENGVHYFDKSTTLVGAAKNAGKSIVQETMETIDAVKSAVSQFKDMNAKSNGQNAATMVQSKQFEGQQITAKDNSIEVKRQLSYI